MLELLSVQHFILFNNLYSSFSTFLALSVTCHVHSKFHIVFIKLLLKLYNMFGVWVLEGKLPLEKLWHLLNPNGFACKSTFEHPIVRS